ncbi:aminoglycoside phosphotransferase family protein [Anaeromicropila herbilytica]|uniref:Aminoglycoside phosphotransferase domain-containing protein n=1 Tax=Anaeromicropila herbilytica TaxID=2785025 RepID=A0A7R7IBN4_9FIRM|nr:aminoglycoside phosphotransferase family protein [Anaeromicropila herbilytica]BCN28999.1 hypothetical protein bsdtb5_02940 [Anaeromicropila herbilytica]
MNANSIFSYLENNQIFTNNVTYKAITIGAGGAKVYIITDGEKKYVLKHIPKYLHTDINIYNSYERELHFYELNELLRLPYIPNTIFHENSNEHGIILVMNYYSPINKESWNINLQKQAIDICAKINSIPIDKINSLDLQHQKIEINKQSTENSYNDWKFVLSQHKDKFEDKVLDEIYKNIEIVCPVLNSEPHCLCHGDFHPENILYDGDQLFVCDWQGINIGKSINDISFFISRGLGMGIDMKEEQLLDYYCERVSLYKNKIINKEKLLKEKYASTVLCTFSFWAQYLKNSSFEQVAIQYNGMVDAFQKLYVL